jgi:hypothetical protein
MLIKPIRQNILIYENSLSYLFELFIAMIYIIFIKSMIICSFIFSEIQLLRKNIKYLLD